MVVTATLARVTAKVDKRLCASLSPLRALCSPCRIFRTLTTSTLYVCLCLPSCFSVCACCQLNIKQTLALANCVKAHIWHLWFIYFHLNLRTTSHSHCHTHNSLSLSLSLSLSPFVKLYLPNKVTFERDQVDQSRGDRQTTDLIECEVTRRKKERERNK